MLNTGKTEFIMIRTRHIGKVKIDHIRVGDCNIKPATSVRNLGTCFDEKLTLATHVIKIGGSAFLPSSQYQTHLKVFAPGCSRDIDSIHLSQTR